MEWPDKHVREEFEIKGFIESYSRLPQGIQFQIVTKNECPDYVVKDIKTDEEYGVELTSVYRDDRSVPDVHMEDGNGLVEIPYDKNELQQYEKRLIAAVIDKVCKARKGYETERPLILAIYVNEYIGIYLGKDELESLVKRYEGVFDSVTPFSEIVFWGLGNGGVFRVRPNINK